MKNTPELLLEFIKFNSPLSLLMLAAFGWIVAKEVEASGEFRKHHWLCVASFIFVSLNLHQLSQLIIAMIKESAGNEPNYVSGRIQDHITYSIYALWTAAIFLVLFLVLQARERKGKAV